MTFRTWSCLLISACPFACGCETARRGAPMDDPVVETVASNAARGEIVFMKNCYPCHGTGEGGVGPAINDKPLPQFMIRLQVRNGVGAMPAFDENEIPDDRLADLLDYISALRRSGPG